MPQNNIKEHTGGTYASLLTMKKHLKIVVAVVLILFGLGIPVAYHLYLKHKAEYELNAWIVKNGRELPDALGLVFYKSATDPSNLQVLHPFDLKKHFSTSWIIKLNNGFICDVAVDGHTKVLSGTFLYNLKHQPLLLLLAGVPVAIGLIIIMAVIGGAARKR